MHFLICSKFQSMDEWRNELTADTIDSYLLCVGDDIFICGICQASLKRKKDLRRHIRDVHLKLRKRPCSFCGVSFVHEYVGRHEKKCKARFWKNKDKNKDMEEYK